MSCVVIEMFRDGDFFDDDSGETYSVVKALSDGGMGSTFIVEHASTGVQYVAKTPLTGTSLECKKVLNEYRILKDLEQKGVDNIVRAHALASSVEVGGKKFPCFLMEFAKDIELNKYLQKNGPVDPKDVEDYLLKISKTMSEVHKAGYIHRDMKPENLFVKDAGGANQFTIIDWGIAAVKDDHNTFALTQTKAWTPFWCPPEQEQGTVSIGNDIFSLGAIGYAMVVPYDEIIRDSKNSISPPYNPKFKLGGHSGAEHLYKVIEKATQPSRGDRFATMQEFADALEGKKPPEAYPRIVADGTSHPLAKEKNEWFIGRNSPVDSQADILVNETGGPGSRYISRKQVRLERTGDASFLLHHQGLNDTRVGIDKNGTIDWRNIEKGSRGWPLGPRYCMICFGYADHPPGKVDTYGNPLQPGPYKVIEFFPPNADAVVD
jgi:serine/threonine protein kinase